MILGNTYGKLHAKRVGASKSRQVLNQRGPIQGDYTLGQHPHELRIRDDNTDELVRNSYVIGVDLGAMVDPAAMAIVRTRMYDERFVGPRWPYTEVIWLQRWPSGDPGFYPRIRRDVIDLAMQLPGAVTIVPDHGGVGVAWNAELREHAQHEGFTGRIVPVASTGNNANALTHTDTSGRLRMTVPKIELVSALNLAQQSRLINPCPNCQPMLTNTKWQVKDLAKVLQGTREGDTGTVVWVGDGEIAVQFEECHCPDDGYCTHGYVYDPIQLVHNSGPPPTDACLKCARLRFTKTVDRNEYAHLRQELKTFKWAERAVTGVDNRIEQGSRTGVKHHGDSAIALALALWFTGRGNRQLTMFVGGR